MRKLSFTLVAALLITLAINATKTAKAEVSLEVSCGCQSTPTPTVTPTATPIATLTPTPTAPGRGGPSDTPGPQMPGPSMCPLPQPDPPVVTSVVRKSTSATITWTKVSNADKYLIFYGTKPGSTEFGVPDTGNVTTYTINALNPKLQYYFDVRSVNSCQPSNPSASSGQVLGASTTILGATSADPIISRIIIGIIGGIITFKVVKKHSQNN